MYANCMQMKKAYRVKTQQAFDNQVGTTGFEPVTLCL